MGSLVTVTGVFTNPKNNDAKIDPDIVHITYEDPEGTETTKTYGDDVEVVKDATGEYHFNIDGSLVGIYYYRWWSTGTGQAAVENQFNVEQARAA